MWGAGFEAAAAIVILVAATSSGGCRRGATDPAAASPTSLPAQLAVASVEEIPPPKAEVMVPELPTACEGDTQPCLPPADFVAELCQGKFTSVAISMFQKSQPWTHAFVKVRQVMPVNAFSGPITHVPLAFSEEVVLLNHRPFVPTPGYDIPGPDRFDVLRLSGTCASLAEDEMRDHWAGPSTYAPLVWSWLEPAYQSTLSSSGKVEEAKTRQQEVCGGRYIGGGSAACQSASDALVRAIMAEVNAGMALPHPETLPAWMPAAR